MKTHQEAYDAGYAAADTRANPFLLTSEMSDAFLLGADDAIWTRGARPIVKGRGHWWRIGAAQQWVRVEVRQIVYVPRYGKSGLPA